MRSRRLELSLAAVLTLATAALPLSAAQHSAVFGRAGEVYKVRAGSYGELFPNGQATAANDSVLAVDIARPGAVTQRVLVPDSSGAAVDEEPSLFFDDPSGSLYLIWQARSAGNLAQIVLDRFDGTSWSDVTEISGAPAPLKGRPQLAVTRMTYRAVAGEAEHTITTLHVIWWEEGQPVEAAYYTPVVLEDGVYLGWNPVFRLNDIDRSDFAEDGDPSTRALFRSPAMDSGRDASSVVLGFANPRTARLVTMEFAALPLELSRLGDEVRSHIIGAGTYDLGQIAGAVRSHIIGAGSVAHASVLSYLADQAVARILNATGLAALDLRWLADDVRSHIIGAGAEALLANRLDPGKPTSIRLIELPSSPDSGLPSHLIALRAVTARPLPAVDSNDVTVHVSATGEGVLVTWWDGRRLHYRESDGDGWTDVRDPNLPRGLGEDPERLLTERLRY